MSTEARRFTIRGRVQGVFFRDSTRQQALLGKISGHAMNLENGDVEVLAVGKPAQLDELAEWLRQGPPLARVDDVRVEEVAAGEVSGFKVG
jgi:acylphosphatase